MKRSYNINSEIEQNEIQIKINKQDFERKKQKIIAVCNDFIEVLDNSLREFNVHADKPLIIDRRNDALSTKFNDNFLSFNYNLVCKSLEQEEMIKNDKKNNEDDYYINEMYLKQNIVAGGFLRIGKNNESGYETFDRLSLSSSWGCNFLISYNLSTEQINWYLVKNNFMLAPVTHSKETFCIIGIENLMRFGSRKFMPMVDIVQNNTTEFVVNESSMVQFLDKLIV